MISPSSKTNDASSPVHPRRLPGLIRRSLRRSSGLQRLSLVAFLAIPTFAFLPIQFPSVVTTYARITSAQKWVLIKGRDGQLIATTFNYATGLSEGYGVSNFDRGSSVHFSVNPSLLPGQLISRGDTIGTVYSSDIQERIIALNGQLATARGLLAVNATGEKAAIVQEAQQRLTFALRRTHDYQGTLTRANELFQNHLISQAEYEPIRNQANSLSDQVDVAAATLEAARTGAKPAQLELVHANIAALEGEIDALKRRAATYTLTAPISGTLSRAFSADTLLSIADTTRYVALIPLRLSDYSRVSKTPNARLTLSDYPKVIHGRIIALNRELLVLHGEHVVIATAVLDESSPDLLPGMFTRCRIACQPVTPAAYLKQALVSLPRLTPWWSS